MDQRPVDPLVAVAVLGLCAVAFMLGAAFAGSLNWKYVLDVATAVGTVGAAVVAAWLGVAATRRLQAEALDRASLVAARLLPIVAPVVSDLQVFFLIYPEKIPEDPIKEAKGQVRLLRSLRDSLRAALPQLDIGREDLLSLTPLPKRAAARLARGVSIARSTYSFVEAQLADPDWDSNPPIRRRADVAFAFGSVREAVNLCEIAVKECERLVNIAATHPTYEELYGEHRLAS